MAGSKWTAEEDAEALALSSIGLTARQVAEKVNRSYDSVRHRLKVIRSGEAERQKRSPWTDTTVAKLKRMNERGVSPADMASALGMPREKVHYQVHPMWSLPEEERRLAFIKRYEEGCKATLAAEGERK